MAESSRYFRAGKSYGGRGDIDEEDARIANTRKREEKERGIENEIERGKGEYEARVSGRVNNNARRQMSSPPPLFA